ncbi:periplasmic binding protein-like I [Hesseltinella vesiculosa]|uniref:Periplasmic binding protein-like I n=1 Tax=Hesseltinella vesiculosa TaxID=101127 RepID=A0A1X2G2H6_9FUNG|nr:periplasmic binding protein-like I [Hesseltinella vesiculosa]
MAVNEINAQHLIPGAYVTLIEKDSFPDSSVDQAAVTNAVYSLVTLLQDGVIGVIGDVTSSWTALSALITSTLNLPQCSFTASSEAFSDKSQYGYFFRTIPTDIVMIDALLRFVAQQGWTKVGVLYSDDALGQQLYQRTIQQSEQLNIQLVNYQSFPASNPTSTAVNNALHNVTNSGARVLLLASSGQAQADFMVQAALSGYVTADYVWLLVDDTVARVLPNTLQQANANLTMATSFNGIFWISNWLTLNGYSPYDNFLNQWDALDSAMLAYSCMMMMAHGFKNMVTNSTNQTNQLWQLASGDLDVAMKPNVFNVGYVGPNGPMLLDSNGDMMAG